MRTGEEGDTTVSSTSEHQGPEALPTAGRGFPLLRVGTACVTAIGLCLAAGLGIAAILGASLDVTAAKLAGSGVICGFFGLFAVGASTLHQRNLAGRLLALAGVATAALVVVVLLISIWAQETLSNGLGRAVGTAATTALTIGLCAFLISQQRTEDTAGVRALMLATILLLTVLGTVTALEAVFASGRSATASTPGDNVAFFASGLDYARFVGVTGTLSLLGLLLLPVVRRGNPRFGSGQSPPA